MLLTLPRPRSTPARCALSVGIVLFAYALQAAIWDRVPPSPCLLFYPAVFVIAWWLGRRPAIVAIGVSSLGVTFSVAERVGAFGIPLLRDVIDLTLFIMVCAATTLGLETLRGSLQSEREARKNAEAANLAKDEVLAMVSHDLRDPIAAMSLSAELIQRTNSLDDAHEHAVRIRRLAHHATDLVGDILTYAKADAGALELRPSEVSIRELVERACEAAKPTAEARQITLQAQAADALARCDRGRVLQVLGNLIGNALKFTDAGGTVVVRAERIGDAIGVEVRDTGSGIAPSRHERIFDRYFTGDSRRGAGLGLHIARLLVHAHGGEIGVESDVGAGSTFWFTLPVPDTDSATRAPVRLGGRLASPRR